MSAWIGLLGTLLGTVVGTVLGAVLQYTFWKRQYREISHTMERRERQRERHSAAERIQNLATQTIELASSPFSGPHISQTEVTTQTYIELLKLQRELRAVTASIGGLFSDQRHQQLENFQNKLSQNALRNPSPQLLDSLRTDLKNLYDDLRKDITRSL